jgi:CO/xanthine dehydrogenase Mo-binding subunit
MTTRFGLGQPVRRSEDRRFLTGRGRYADDINLPGQAYGFVVRSPHAHARIAGVDVAAAAAAPGVVAVLTGADFAADGIGSIPPTYLPQDRGASGAAPSRIFGQHAIAADRVRHVGEPVAYVVAETLEEARDAAELVAVGYAPLPAVAQIVVGAPLAIIGAIRDALRPLGVKGSRCRRRPIRFGSRSGPRAPTPARRLGRLDDLGDDGAQHSGRLEIHGRCVGGRAGRGI